MLLINKYMYLFFFSPNDRRRRRQWQNNGFPPNKAFWKWQHGHSRLLDQRSPVGEEERGRKESIWMMPRRLAQIPYGSLFSPPIRFTIST